MRRQSRHNRPQSSRTRGISSTWIWRTSACTSFDAVSSWLTSLWVSPCAQSVCGKRPCHLRSTCRNSSSVKRLNRSCRPDSQSKTSRTTWSITCRICSTTSSKPRRSDPSRQTTPRLCTVRSSSSSRRRCSGHEALHSSLSRLMSCLSRPTSAWVNRSMSPCRTLSTLSSLRLLRWRLRTSLRALAPLEEVLVPHLGSDSD